MPPHGALSVRYAQLSQGVALAIDAALAEQDDPSMDCTDGAHPAWWRGHDHTARVFCQIVTKILDGRDDGQGFNVEPWGTVRQRLLALTEQAAELNARRLSEATEYTRLISELGAVIAGKDSQLNVVRGFLEVLSANSQPGGYAYANHDGALELLRQVIAALALTPATVHARTEKERRVVEAAREWKRVRELTYADGQALGAIWGALAALAALDAPPEGA